MKLSTTLLLALLTLSAHAHQFTVDPSEGFSGIQAAINDANDGDQIILTPGVYTGIPDQSINMLGKSITLRSQDPNDVAVVRTTILQCASDANQSTSAIRFQSEFVGTSTLSGLTITGGLTRPAIMCHTDSQVILDSCVIRDNYAHGLDCCEASLVLIDCVFQKNRATFGGAVLCDDSEVEMQDCVFIQNLARGEGGGIYLSSTNLRGVRCQWIGNLAISGAGLYMDYSTLLNLSNCLWSGNRALETGGGLMLDGGSVELTNCSLAGNVADEEGGAIVMGSDDLSMTNCIVAYNQDRDGLGRSITGTSSGRGGRSGRTTLGISPEDLLDLASISHCCLQLDPGETEAFVDANDIITDDPLFASIPDGGSDGWGDDPYTLSIDESLNDDYGDLHLRVDSPCINTGSSLTWSSLTGLDLDGGPRHMGADTDMGAYEFNQPTLKVTRPQGGEVWAAGSSQQLTWSSVGTDEPVDILFRSVPGGSWQSLATGVTNSGAYLWDLPIDLQSYNEQIRVTLTTPDPNQYIVDSAGFVVVLDQNGVETHSPWSTLAGNSQHTGQGMYKGPLSPVEAWDINIPGELYTSVTLGVEDRLHVASENGVLYTFSSTGQALWTIDINSPLLTAPTVGPDGSVYVGAQDGRLYALHHDGTLRWTWETEGFLYASATVSDTGTVYVAGLNGILYALSSNGSLLWSYQVPALDHIADALLASPALGVNGEVLIGSFYEPRLYALSPDEGTVLWSCLCADTNATLMSEKGSIFASPVVAPDGTIYQGLIDDPNLYAISPEGEIRWVAQTVQMETLQGGSVWSEPAVGSDRTLYYALDEDAYLRAISPEDGSLKWVTRLGTGDGFSLAVGADGMIYAAGDDGVLYVVNSDGQIAAELPIGNSLAYPVVGIDGVLILSDVTHGVRVYHDLF